MDQFIDQSLHDFNIIPAITLWELVIVLTVSAILNLVLARVYAYTHSGHSYSRSYVHTMVFVGITISLIMLIIGSNIARAFALVGAMSIIRFRNPVKDSRDIAFLFIAMAIGMAAGTKFYSYAAIFTAFISTLAVAMHALEFGTVSEISYVVRVRMRDESRSLAEKKLQDVTRRYAIISVDKLSSDGEFCDYIYELSLETKVPFEEVMKSLGSVSSDISLTMLVGEGDVNV